MNRQPWLRKILGVDAEHRSRFHTRRGERATALDQVGLIACMARRLLRPPSSLPKSPWMSPGAVRRLNTLLTPGMRLLEFGAGSSTAWYAERVADVLAIEPDAEWASRVRQRVARKRNARVIESGVSSVLSTLDLTSFDVVILDHNDEESHSRLDTLRGILQEARPAIIVLDDSDRAEYSAADEILHGYAAERYVGFRSRPLRVTETSIYQRL